MEDDGLPEPSIHIDSRVAFSMDWDQVCFYLLFVINVQSIMLAFKLDLIIECGAVL